jgi:hypothetical protein
MAYSQEIVVSIFGLEFRAIEGKEDPTPKFDIFSQAKDGEKLFSDSDWMTESYRKAIASYTGDPRHFSTFPVQLRKEDDSLLNIQPARE